MWRCKIILHVKKRRKSRGYVVLSNCYDFIETCHCQNEHPVIDTILKFWRDKIISESAHVCKKNVLLFWNLRLALGIYEEHPALVKEGWVWKRRLILHQKATSGAAVTKLLRLYTLVLQKRWLGRTQRKKHQKDSMVLSQQALFDARWTFVGCSRVFVLVLTWLTDPHQSRTEK